MDDQEEARDIFGELIPTGGADNSLAAFADEITSGLSNINTSIASQGPMGGASFFGLNRQGVFHYGADGIKMDPKATAIVNLRSVRHGYSAWDDGKLLGEVMFAANEKLPSVNSLPDHGVDWEMCVSFELVFLPGTADDGAAVLYKNSSKGGREAVAKLMEKVKAAIRLDPTKTYPIIGFSTTSWHSKKYGEIFKPVFSLIRMTDGRSVPSSPAPKSPSPTKAEAPAPEAGRRRRVPA
jgi:hypothetical protein